MISSGNIKGISEHISYEIEMFEMCADKLRRGGLNQFEQNAFLEGFVLHARCLVDFLFPPNNIKEDDVIADHFFDDPKVFRDSLPKLQKLVELIKLRTGKEVAHLTYKRLDVTPEMKIWQVSEIRNEINEALVVFFKFLSEEQRNWFPLIVSG